MARSSYVMVGLTAEVWKVLPLSDALAPYLEEAPRVDLPPAPSAAEPTSVPDGTSARAVHRLSSAPDQTNCDLSQLALR